MQTQEALQIYRNKDVIEKRHDDMKTHLDLKRMRMPSSGRMSARIFVQFIALNRRSQIQRMMREHALSDRLFPKLLLREMESLSKIHYAGKYNDILSKVSKTQREILQTFSIDPNTL